MAFNISQIVDQYGKYYIDAGQNQDRVLKLLKQKTVTTEHAVPKQTKDTVYRLANAKFATRVQAFQKTFTEKGGAEFIPQEIHLRQLKVDETFYPDDITESWLGFLSGLDVADRKDWPIVRYMVEHDILPQIPHDMEMLVYGKGKYKAPTAGTASAAEDAMDGLIALCDAGILNANSPMNSIVLDGVIDATNAVAKLESVKKSIPRLYRDNIKMKVFVDPEIFDNYQENYRDRFSRDPRYSDALAGTIDFATNLELVPLPSLSETGAIIVTPAENFLHIRRGNQQAPTVQSLKREVFIMTDWWEAIGFGFNELVWYYKPTATV